MEKSKQRNTLVSIEFPSAFSRTRFLRTAAFTPLTNGFGTTNPLIAGSYLCMGTTTTPMSYGAEKITPHLRWKGSSR